MDAFAALSTSQQDDRIITENGTFEKYVPAPARYRMKNRQESQFWSMGVRLQSVHSAGVARAWRCYQCKEVILLADGQPSNAQKHMERKHGWRKGLYDPSSTTGDGIRTSPVPMDFEERPRPIITQMLFQPNIKEWRRATLRWMLEDHVPFAWVEHNCWRQQQVAANPGLEKYLFSKQTARNWVEDEFVTAKEGIRMILKESLSKIHISIDIWQADYVTYAFLGVNAHFVRRRPDGSLTTESILLAMRRLREKHSGEYQASILASVVEEYDFVDNFGVVVADNAGDNNTAVKHLFARLQPSLKDTTGKRVRCLAHIVNLAAKAFLYAEVDWRFNEEEKEEDEADFSANTLAKAQDVWRQRGPLGKLHNTIVFIRRSATRKEEFRNINIGNVMVDGKWYKNLSISKCQNLLSNRANLADIPAQYGLKRAFPAIFAMFARSRDQY